MIKQLTNVKNQEYNWEYDCRVSDLNSNYEIIPKIIDSVISKKKNISSKYLEPHFTQKILDTILLKTIVIRNSKFLLIIDWVENKVIGNVVVNETREEKCKCYTCLY